MSNVINMFEWKKNKNEKFIKKLEEKYLFPSWDKISLWIGDPCYMWDYKTSKWIEITENDY